MSEVSAPQPSTAAPSGQIARGARIGKYEIVHRIACGGMAEIYLARASGLYGFEKHVVLKRILPQYAANEEFVRMFLKEARVAASLDHANIAHVHDIGEAGGHAFFTMEYLHGEDLRHVLRNLERGEQRMPLEHAIEIAIGAAAGLHFAHDKRGPDGRPLGIVHRDISPANIVVTYDGGVKLVDFGIAKLATDPELSQRYALKGKLAYMSPEQFHNQRVDRRSDVFALGIVLYEMTTQTRLFKGATEAQTMKAVLDCEVPPPSTHVTGYPAALERIVMRALARAPEDRYQSARELHLDLETFVHDERIRLSPAALAEWMEQTCGPKQEIWRTLPTAEAGLAEPAGPGSGSTSRSGAGSSAPRDPTVATKVVSRADLEAVPSAPALGASIPIDVSAPVRPRRPRWLGGVVALGLVVAGGALWTGRGVAVSARATEASGPVVLVAEQGHVAVERGAAAEPPTPSAPAPAPATSNPTSAPAAAPTPAEPPAPAKSKHAGSGSARGGSFSSIFARRENDIRRCFLTHKGSASSNEISLRFEVDRGGHVTAVTVLPDGVGNTPLGACLAGVARTTVFSKQAAPLTFRIPLTVQLEAAGKNGS